MEESLHIDENKSHAIVHWKEKTKTSSSKDYKATVDFDPETLRVWDLFITNEVNESVEKEEGPDAEEFKNNKKTMKENIEKFLTYMRILQGISSSWYTC